MGPQGLGVKGNNGYSIGSPNKLGPCGDKPGQTPCKDELKRMSKDMGYSGSYQENMKVEDGGQMKRLPSGMSFMTLGHVHRSAKALTNKRVKNLTNNSSYKVLTDNPSAGPVVKGIKKFIAGASKKGSPRYQVPSAEEAKSILEIGGKYAGSENFGDSVSTLDKGKLLYHGWKLASKYPNIKEIAKKHGASEK